MAAAAIATNTRGPVTLDDGVLDRPASRLQGATVVRPGDATYDVTPQAWNTRIGERSAPNGQRATASDVESALVFAREHGLVPAVCGGGRDIADHASCDGGLVIDPFPMPDGRSCGHSEGWMP